MRNPDVDPRGRLPRLIDRVRAIAESAGTPAWGDLWDRSAASDNVSMFAFPNPVAGTGRAPYVLCPDANFYARLLGYNLADVFTDAGTYLCFALEQKVWEHEHLHHDGSVSKTVLINMLGFFAPSLFGAEIVYAADAVPWIAGTAIEDEADLARLEPPDFFTAGLSPLAHHMYEEARALLPDDFWVEFTTWLTGPFSLIFHLRGPLRLALDMADDPGFVHAMMELATDAMIAWWEDRARFTGEALEPLILGDDEVGAPLTGPRHYEEFVLPYETRLAEHFGGIDYWHSCADNTRLLPVLARLPDLRMMDVGPWTALQPAVELFGRRAGSSIMKRLHPVSEVLMATEEAMRARLRQIKATCYDVPYMLFFDGLNVLDSVEDAVEKALLLDRTCHAIFHEDDTRPAVEPEPAP
jgi:uroporphyrinogen-III decarboxylase